VPCAWAKETPATSAATAARVVNVFIRLPPCLVMPVCGNLNNGNRETVFRELARFRKKSFKKRRRNGKRPGNFPAAGPRLSRLRDYASTIATISCVRGLMITI
jgi:hypothetical protein